MYWRVEIELFINDNTKSSQIQLLQVLFSRLITNLLKIYFLCTYDDQMKKQQRFCIKLSFTNFSLVFFQLFSKFSTNICKIYELPKIYNKIPKTQPNTCFNNNNLQENVVPKVFFFVVSDVVPNVYSKPWRLLSFNEIIQI